MANCSNHRPGQLNFICTPGGKESYSPEQVLHFNSGNSFSWQWLTALGSRHATSGPEIICGVIIFLLGGAN